MGSSRIYGIVKRPDHSEREEGSDFARVSGRRGQEFRYAIDDVVVASLCGP